eukprot:3324299-Rhodomonas_salina.1
MDQVLASFCRAAIVCVAFLLVQPLLVLLAFAAYDAAELALYYLALRLAIAGRVKRQYPSTASICERVQRQFPGPDTSVPLLCPSTWAPLPRAAAVCGFASLVLCAAGA